LSWQPNIHQKHKLFYFYRKKKTKTKTKTTFINSNNTKMSGKNEINNKVEDDDSQSGDKIKNLLQCLEAKNLAANRVEKSIVNLNCF
jgi:hypothetical protein